MADWSSPAFLRQAVGLYRAKVESTSYGAQTVTQRQAATTAPVSPKPPTWVSKFDIPGPGEDDARRLLCKTIDHYDEGKERYKEPEIGRLEAHWVGYSRSDVIVGLEKSLSEKKKWRAMKGQASSPAVIFFVHGGTFTINSPGQYYKLLTRLAKQTEGRCFCVRQRLAPQHPFPEALLDLFHGYLSLLVPPPGSVHDPIPASDIVLAGDSSGACLATGLLQVLLTIQREAFAKTITFYGKPVDTATWLPAGLTGMTAAVELANGLPSYSSNAKFDIFPSVNPTTQPWWPACSAWPASPPRAHLYCNTPYLYHPIASPAMCENWTGSPPMWFASGQEQLVDGVKLLVQTAARQGVSVSFSEYEGMPHYWPVVFTDSPQSQKFWSEWSDAIVAMVSAKRQPNRAVFVRADLTEEKLHADQLLPLLTHEKARLMSVQATASLQPFTGKKQPAPKI